MGDDRTTTGPTVQIPATPDLSPNAVPEPLPIAGQRRERADAVANRARILAAARRLVTEHGVDGLTMQAVATAAGVGKGTVFHRFGDRDGLTGALVDEYMREFQDLFLHGPPPLGPGAPALERLEAFVVELVARQVDNLELARAAESRIAGDVPPIFATLLMHVRLLVSELVPEAESGVIAGYLLSAFSPLVLHQMRLRGELDVPTLQRAAVRLVRGLGAD